MTDDIFCTCYLCRDGDDNTTSYLLAVLWITFARYLRVIEAVANSIAIVEYVGLSNVNSAVGTVQANGCKSLVTISCCNQRWRRWRIRNYVSYYIF